MKYSTLSLKKDSVLDDDFRVDNCNQAEFIRGGVILTSSKDIKDLKNYKIFIPYSDIDFIESD